MKEELSWKRLASLLGEVEVEQAEGRSKKQKTQEYANV